MMKKLHHTIQKVTLFTACVFKVLSVIHLLLWIVQVHFHTSVKRQTSSSLDYIFCVPLFCVPLTIYTKHFCIAVLHGKINQVFVCYFNVLSHLPEHPADQTDAVAGSGPASMGFQPAHEHGGPVCPPAGGLGGGEDGPLRPNTRTGMIVGHPFIV